MDSNAIGTNPQKPNKSSLHSPIPGVILNLRRLLEGCPAWWACTCRGPGLVARVATHTASKTRTSAICLHLSITWLQLSTSHISVCCWCQARTNRRECGNFHCQHAVCYLHLQHRWLEGKPSRRRYCPHCMTGPVRDSETGPLLGDMQ